MFLPVVLSEQLVPGSFAFALNLLVDEELDLSALDARFRNEEVGASAYDPRVLLKIVLLGYSRGLVSSRQLERACEHDIQFIAISGDSHPSHAQLAKFVSGLGPQIKALFHQVLLTCDAQGLIGRELFAIDGVKLPANASKERSGTHAELLHRARRLEKAAEKIVSLHQAQDSRTGTPGDEALQARRQQRVDALRREAQRTREFLRTTTPRRNRKGQELKTNITDPDSAKMATSKGVIQGYAAQAAVDARHQVIIAADITGSGSEQAMLLPMVEQARPFADAQTLVTADAGYHSDVNVQALHAQGRPALIADTQMRQRDERFKDHAQHKAQPDPLYDKQATGQGKPSIKHFGPSDFRFDPKARTAICPAGQTLRSSGAIYQVGKGQRREDFKARPEDCQGCALRTQCLRHPERTAARKVSLFHARELDPNDPSQRMRRAIDSPQGRALYSRRIATVEPVFANLRHNKRLSRFTLRGTGKVGAQWQLFCLVHNIEKLAHSGWRR
ncbi:IS1182 family transposase [Roseateles sp. DAIF2]|uniref:IS1182 family transposase n=1 Tax=Roseateles sp. DAIF2 TaxID=2714952 RepID=UPI0018A30244|nr:IS1182 family transposase [Roseateles sp. DAIF2]QPF73629.1 IS1182 family transposase [Roseateles sp. DAIF2]